MKKKCIAVFLAVATALSLSGCNLSVMGNQPEPVENEADFQPVVLKFSNQHPANSVASETDQRICDRIAEATDGRVTVQLYTDSSLGDYTSVWDEVMVGSIDIAHTTPVETYNQKMSASMLPYLGSTYEELARAYSPDNYLYQQIAEAQDEIGLHFFGFFCEGYNGFGMGKEIKNATDPSQDKGVVVRSPGATIYSKGAKGLGFRTSSIAYSDTYTAIQTGVVDGWLGGPANLNYLYFRDVINTFYDYHYNQESTLVYMNKKRFDSLLPKDQEAIQQIFEEECAGTVQSAQEDDQKYKDMLKEAGVEVVEFSDEELENFASYVRENVWPEFANSFGQEFLDNVAASVNQ